MDKLMAENPELQEAVVAYGTAIQELELVRKEKCDGRILVCNK